MLRAVVPLVGVVAVAVLYTCLGSVSPSQAPEPPTLVQAVPQVGLAGSAFTFSPDGTRLASMGDGNLLVWDVATGAVAVRFDGLASTTHDPARRPLAFSRDGHWIAFAGEYRIIVADPRSGEEVVDLRDLEGSAAALCFSPDDELLAAVARGRLAVWDTSTWAPPDTPSDAWSAWGAAPALAFSPREPLLAVSDGAQRRIHMVDTAKMADAGTIDWEDPALQGAEFEALAFSPDGSTITARDFCGKVGLWDVATRTAVPTLFELQEREVRDVAAHPTKSLLVIGDLQNRVTVLDYHSGGPVWEHAARDDIVWSVGFTPDGRLLAASDGRRIGLWQAETGEPAGTIGLAMGEPSPFAVSPDGRSLASVTPDGTVALWDTGTGGLAATLAPAVRPAECLGFCAQGSRFVAAGRQGAVVWDVASREVVTSIDAGEGRNTTGAAPSPDGTLLAVASERTDRRGERGRPEYQTYGRIGLHDSASGRLLRDLAAETEGLHVVAMVFSPDGRRLLVQSALMEPVDPLSSSFASCKERLAMLDVQNGQTAWELEGEAASVQRPAFVGGSRYVVGAFDGRIKTLDAETGEVLRVDDPGFWVAEVSAAPDGRSLLCSTGTYTPDPAARLVDSETGDVIGRIPLERAQHPQVSPTGGWCAVGGPSGVKILDVKTGQCRAVLWAIPAAHEGNASAWDGEWLAFTPDGYYTGSEGAQRHLRFRDEEGKLHTAGGLPQLHDPGRVRKALEQ